MLASCPVLKGNQLFRPNELIYINKSTELEEYCSKVHKHDFIEIAYVLSGTGVHIVGEYEYEISKGDLFVVNYDIPHGFFPKPQDSVGPIVYNCIFKPEFLDVSLLSSQSFQDITSSFLFKSLFPEDYTPNPDLKLSGTEFTEIGSLFNKMYTEYKLMEKGYCDILRALLIELIIKVFRYMDDSSKKKSNLKNHELMNKAIEYMKSNYNSEIKLEDLAMKTFISKNYFSKIFKETTGKNVSDYIKRLRIDEACNLLKNSDRTVTDIAYQTGFKDIKFFYETFKKITGKTPGFYRKN